jgi:hypothetical protein
MALGEYQETTGLGFLVWLDFLYRWSGEMVVFSDPRGGVLFAQICAYPEGTVIQKILGLKHLYGSDRSCSFWQI